MSAWLEEVRKSGKEKFAHLRDVSMETATGLQAPSKMLQSWPEKRNSVSSVDSPPFTLENAILFTRGGQPIANDTVIIENLSQTDGKILRNLDRVNSRYFLKK